MSHVGGHVISAGDGFGSSASSINSGGLAMDGGNTPRNVRQRKDSSFREADAREFERYVMVFLSLILILGSCATISTELIWGLALQLGTGGRMGL